MKLKASISALVFVATIGLATAQNQSQEKGQHAKNTQKSTAFIDKNNNGVCDNFENATPMPMANKRFVINWKKIEWVP